MEKDTSQNTSLISIDNASKDIINKISKAKNKDELETLYQEFNINNTKKNAIRISQLNELLDKVNNEAAERLIKRPEQISNKEILDYMTAIGNQIERSQKLVDGIKDINAVQVNNTQNTVNINVGNETKNLSKQSRDKIRNIIADILNEKKEEKDKIIEVESDEKIDVENNIDITSTDEFEGDD